MSLIGKGYKHDNSIHSTAWKRSSFLTQLSTGQILRPSRDAGSSIKLFWHGVPVYTGKRISSGKVHHRQSGLERCAANVRNDHASTSDSIIRGISQVRGTFPSVAKERA